MSGAMPKVVVIGAGLVGCTLALLLSRRGYQVEVIEARPDPRIHPPPPGRSNHLVLSARGLSALGRLELLAEVDKIAVPLHGRMVHALDGRRTPVPYGREGQVILAVSRALLNAVLVHAVASAPNLTVTFETRCIGVNWATKAIELEHSGTGARSQLVNTPVFAADGAFSKARGAMLRLDRFDYMQSYLPYGHKELTIARADGAGTLENNRTHVWPRGKRMMTAFPNPDGGFGATLLMPFEGEDSFASTRTPEDLDRLFERYLPDVRSAMPNLAKDFFEHPTVSVVSNKCYPWVHENWLALIGDAAHSVVPFLGQGMNAGFEDCLLLDQLIEQLGGDWPKVLSAYQRERKPNCDALMEMSGNHFFELADRVGDPEFVLKRSVELRAYELCPDKFVPLYAMVAFTHIPYAQVKRIAEEQDRVVAKLMAIPNIDSALRTRELDSEIRRLLEPSPKIDLKES